VKAFRRFAAVLALCAAGAPLPATAQTAATSASGAGAVGAYVTLAAYLAALEGKLSQFMIANGCKLEDLDAFMPPSDAYPPPRFLCDPGFVKTPDELGQALCSVAQAQCTLKYDCVHCRANHCGQTGSDFSTTFRNTPPRERWVFEQAMQLFENGTRSEPALASCCGSDAKCRAKLSSTRFYVLDGLPAGDERAEFDVDRKAIVASAPALRECLNQECVHYTMQHLVSYACRCSRFDDCAEIPSDPRDPDSKEWCDDPAPAQEHLRQFLEARNANGQAFTAETRECIQQGMKRGVPPGACLHSWYEELYADALTVRSLDLVADYSQLCGHRLDPQGKLQDTAEHPSTGRYLGCFASDPAVRRAICERKFTATTSASSAK
jgi:hypothetical protein